MTNISFLLMLEPLTASVLGDCFLVTKE